jgi:hypothetical protein
VRLASGVASRIVCSTLTGTLGFTYRDWLFIHHVGRFVLTRLRLGVLLALAVTLGAFSLSPEAMAAAEVRRLNLVISAMPSQINGGGMNDLLERYNQNPLNASGRSFEPIDRLGMAWLFDGELRYFVRPNFALAAGVSRLKVQTKREFLPSIGASINVLGEVSSVPVHVGAQYYLAPYTQGDFQARAFVGGGLMSLTGTQATFSTNEVGLPIKATTDGTPDTLDLYSLGGAGRLVAGGDSPGYYAEVGAHLFFAARYSVIVGAVYRSMKIRNLANEGVIMVPDAGRLSSEPPLQVELLDLKGKPVRIPELDLSGLGVRMAVAIGF